MGTTRSPINFTTKKPNGNDDLCNSKIDAVVRTADGSSFVFAGSLYWKLTSDSVAAGYPRKIYQDWPGLPNDIDAAVTWDSNRITYFFKGDKYWRFTNQSPTQGYPKPMSKWLGLPNNLDAAFQWARDGHLYFLKGSQYWRYNTRRNRVESAMAKKCHLSGRAFQLALMECFSGRIEGPTSSSQDNIGGLMTERVQWTEVILL